MTLPTDKQAKRTFSGMMPKYYDRVVFGYPAPDVETLTFWHYNYQTEANDIVAIIEIAYVDQTKEAFSNVARTYYNESY